MNTLALAEQLIKRASVTPEDAGCQSLFEEILRPLGFACYDLGRNQTRNLWARRGSDRPLFAFAGHTDVVPPGPINEWHRDPFEPWVDDRGILYGRGVVDMKGALAAMLTATHHFVQEHPNFKGSLAFLITSDEEGPAKDGTIAALEWLKSHHALPDACLIGEPTSEHQVGDTLKMGRRGSLNGRLHIEGKQGHVAYPDDAVNPLHAAADFIQAFLSHDWGKGDPPFPPASFQWTHFSGGTGATNVIPQAITLQFNLRFPSPFTSDYFKQHIADFVQQIQKKSRYPVTHSFSWVSHSDPFLTVNPNLIGTLDAAIQEVTGKKPLHATTGGTSDGRFMAPMGIPVVELGLCHETAHQINEHAPAASLEQLTRIYRSFLNRFFQI